MTDKFDAIADGLAQSGFAICDQFLSQSEVDAVLSTESFRDAEANFRKAAIGKKQDHQINEAIRGDLIQWVDKIKSPEPVKVYLRRLEELVGFLNQSLFLSLKDYEVHMTIYPIGSFYKRHLDQFKRDDHRKLSAICYLNNNWQPEHGGQLKIYLPNEELEVLPLAGRLVVFRSDQIEHEVLPSTRERMSLTGWILDQLSDLRHLS